MVFTKLAATICDTPVAAISLLDESRSWLKSKIGIEDQEVPIQNTVCQFTIVQDDILVIENAAESDLVSNNPYISSENGIRFYAGVPLKSKNGFNIGTICVVDYDSKKLTQNQLDSLELIAKEVMKLLERRKTKSSLESELADTVTKKINRSDQKLSQLVNKYDLLYNTVSNSSIIIELDSAGKVLKVNKIFEKITGYKMSNLKGKHYSIFLEQDNKEQLKLLKKEMVNDTVKSVRVKIIGKKGRNIWLQATFNSVKDKNGKISHIITVAQDISKGVKSEQNLIEANLVADKLNSQKDHFIANMSHEIRTPINAVLGFTELLIQLEKEETKEGYLQSVKNAGDKLLFIVNDILDLSKIESGSFQVEQKPFNLEETIKNVFSLLDLKAKGKKIEFIYNIDHEVPLKIVGDKNQLSQILLNLLGNALKFTENGFVKLKISYTKSANQNVTKKAHIKFSVSDSGIGIAKDKTKMIFNRFSQEEDDTSANYGGTGLGLNISKLLVEKQGGAITVISEKGKGSEFIFTIPYTYLSNIEGKKLDFIIDFEKETRKAKILLCEDNFLNQNLVQAIFTTTNYELDIAKDGDLAIKFIEENNYDLILLDIQMPKKNGHQVTKEVRERLKLDVPIIGLSAHSLIKEGKQCLDEGMNDYLSKPFLRRELLEKIHYWLLEDANCFKSFVEELNISEVGYVSLTRLKELSRGNKEIQRKIIKLFIEESYENKAAINKCINEDNRKELSSIIHQLRSSFGLIGASNEVLDLLDSGIKEEKHDLKGIGKCLETQINMLVLKMEHVLENL